MNIDGILYAPHETKQRFYQKKKQKFFFTLNLWNGNDKIYTQADTKKQKCYH